MWHPIYDVISFRIVAPYTLWVRFDDGAEQVIDFSPILCGEVFGPLQDLGVFNQAVLDPELHNLVWPNGVEFDPWTLHDWPQVVDELTARAQDWAHPQPISAVPVLNRAIA